MICTYMWACMWVHASMYVCMYVDKKYVRVHVTNIHEGVGICLSHVHTYLPSCTLVTCTHIPYPHVCLSYVHTLPSCTLITCTHTCLPSCMLVIYPTLMCACHIHVTSVHECMWQAYMRVGMCVHMWRVYMWIGYACVHVTSIHEDRVYAYMWRSYMRVGMCVYMWWAYIRAYSMCVRVTNVHEGRVCMCTCDERTRG